MRRGRPHHQVEPVGIDHFARAGDGLAVAQKAGKLRRNFQGYTDDTAPALIGLGASSISRFPQGYAQNHPATAAYAAQVRYGRLATVRGISLSAEDQLRAEIIERLMCDFWVDIDALVEYMARFKAPNPPYAPGARAEDGGTPRIQRDGGSTCPSGANTNP